LVTLAWRGAVKGLHRSSDDCAESRADRRGAPFARCAARHRVISDVAHRLHMPKMARFVEQLSVTT
jgi:hypothetical protein